MKMKLEKILRLSAFTLLCTSSIMAAVGENMTAGIGVTLGNTIQEQTWMDNYAAADLGNGPLPGIGLGTNIVLSNSGTSSSILDIRNVYYNQAKTNTFGVGFNYKMKGASAENGFYAALDYTKYDDMDFYQAALGHETNLGGYQSNLNFYIPFSSTETYNTPNGSTLVGTYGVDWTLSKQIASVDLGASIGYHWHDDIKNNITAFSLGGEYTFSQNLLTTGLAYQYRDGLDSNDYGYKVYAKMPLHTALKVTTGSGGASMHKPIKRMLGSLIQAKEDTSCTGGFESYSFGGVTACATVNPFTNDGAGFPAAALIKKAFGMKKGIASAVASPNVQTKLQTLKSGKTYLVKHMHVFDGGLNIEPNTNVFLADDASMWINQVDDSGSNTSIGAGASSDKHVIIGSLRMLAKNGNSGIMRMARRIHGNDKRSVDVAGIADTVVKHSDEENRAGVVAFYGKGKIFSPEARDADVLQNDTKVKVKERLFGPARAFDGANVSVADMLSENGNLSLSAATATTNDTAGDSVLTITGINGLSTFGGGTAGSSVGHTVKKTIFADVKVAEFGVNSTYDNVTFHHDRGFAFEQVGGATEMNGVRSKFGPSSQGFAQNRLGGNLQIHGSIFDAQDSFHPRASVVRVIGKNSNTRAAVPGSANAANILSARGIGMTSSIFKGNRFGGNFLDLRDIAGVDNAGAATFLSGNTLDIREMVGTQTTSLSALKDRRMSAGFHGLDSSTSSAVGIVGLASETGADAANGKMGHHIDGISVITGTSSAGAPFVARLLADSLGEKYAKLGTSGFNVKQNTADLDDDGTNVVVAALGTVVSNDGTFADGTASGTFSFDLLESATTDGDGVLMANYGLGAQSDYLQNRVSAGETNAFNKNKSFGPITFQGDGTALATAFGKIARLEDSTVVNYADSDFNNDAQKNLTALNIVKALSGNQTPIAGTATVHSLAGNGGAFRGAATATAATTPIADTTAVTNWTNANALPRANLASLIKSRLSPTATATDTANAADVETNSNTV